MKKIPQLADDPDTDRDAGSPAADEAEEAPDVLVGIESLAPPAEAARPGAARPGAARPDAARPGAARPGAARSGTTKRTGRAQARRFARERALQALYQWDLAAGDSSTVRREFLERQDMSRVDVAYFERLFRGVSHDVEPLDEALGGVLDRPLDRVDPVERAVLRIAAYELAHVLETPARVVVNEGVEITKRFGADNGHRYVNGVLDRLATTLRPIEMRRR